MIAAYPRRLVIYGHMSFPDLNMPPRSSRDFFCLKFGYKKSPNERGTMSANQSNQIMRRIAHSKYSVNTYIAMNYLKTLFS